MHSGKQLPEELDTTGAGALEKATEAELLPNWSIAHNGYKLAEWSKYGAIRHPLNQIAYHRAQLGVYCRLQNIRVAGKLRALRR